MYKNKPSPSDSAEALKARHGKFREGKKNLTIWLTDKEYEDLSEVGRLLKKSLTECVKDALRGLTMI